MKKLLKSKVGFGVGMMVILLVFFLGFQVLILAENTWVGPTQDPTDGNVDAPINVSTEPQAKPGVLFLRELGLVNSVLECVEDPQNPGTSLSDGVIRFNSGSGQMEICTDNSIVVGSGGEGGEGATNYLALTDTPVTYLANTIAFTNATATGLSQSSNLTYNGTNLTLTGGGITTDSLSVVGGLVVDTNTLYVDNSNDRVGIGTASPSAGLGLDVAGKVGATEYCDADGNNCAIAGNLADSYLALSDTPGTFTADAIPYTDATGTALLHSGNLTYDGTDVFQTGGGLSTASLVVAGGASIDTDTLYVDQANNRVGIGMSSPTQTLHVDGAIYTTSGYDICTGDGKCLSGMGGGEVGGGGTTGYIPKWSSPTTQGNSLMSDDGSDVYVNGGGLSADSLVITGGAAFDTNTLYIDQVNNDVGIGTATPSGTLKLDVEGQIGATQYCDETGANCVDIANVGMAAADILAALITVDGSGSGLDADAWDGYDSGAASIYKGELASGIDLNDYKTTGIWTESLNSHAAAGSNFPEAASGILEVNGNGGSRVTQTYTTYTSSNKYFRTWYGDGSTWYPWKKLWYDGNDGAGSGLDADTLDGYNAQVGAGGNTIVQRHSSGYIFANYFNTTPNDVSSGVTKVLVETGNDGYMRHGTAAAVSSFVGLHPGIVAFYDGTSCPTGWSEYTAARGRYIVGLPSGGTAGGTAGTALTNLEDRPAGNHWHKFKGYYATYTFDSKGSGPARTIDTRYSWNYVQTWGSNAHYVRDSYSSGESRSVLNGPEGVDGTNAPYIQLIACEKS